MVSGGCALRDHYPSTRQGYTIWPVLIITDDNIYWSYGGGDITKVQKNGSHVHEESIRAITHGGDKGGGVGHTRHDRLLIV